MKLRDAAIRSVRKFYDGNLPDEAIAASEGEFKYTPEYFDDLLGEDKEEEADDGEKASK